MGRKLILAVLSILLLAGSAQARGLAVVGGGVESSAACDPASNEVGDRTAASSGANIAHDYLSCFLASADCTGSLGDAYALHYNDTGSTQQGLVVCVYSDDGDSSPDSGDSKLGCATTGTTTAAATPVTGSMDGGTVSSGNSYWVCTVPTSAVFSIDRDTTGGTYRYMACTACDESMPATLDGTWTSSTVSATLYVTIE